MNRNKVFTFLGLLLVLIGCKSQIEVPGKYGDFNAFEPIFRLYIQKNNRFVEVYFPAVEKITGKWSVKGDSLILDSEYKSTLENEKDSVVYNEKQIYIIQKNKLINLKNKNFYLKRKK
ncbi:hypothetical protein [Chryseobacterium lathyri]|uniref:Lipoprotein n=1 Tax=Chryseobacterium lathyri TaxID=395933 RepID=A0ABT9STB3_9FLAO|nr:hypothetical protein [Chryseobacterium lathyri]MDP9962232.1 hypothetical protein [Chryseobacterium lathyri]